MPSSEARIKANQANSLKSCGPKTPEGKEASRRNGLKHGLSGDGVVVPESDSDRIAERARKFEAEMAPRTAMGAALIVQIATLSVRVERCFTHQSAASRFRVRHAFETFEDERYDRADELLETLAEDPRKNLRKLKRMPEGIEALIEAWGELRADLTREPKPRWTAEHRERAENLTGKKIDFAHGSRINALTKAIWGDPGPKVSEDEEIGDDALKARARSEMVALIDEQVAALEAEYETIDFDTIDADRADAPDRALFDPSKEASLARRYEADALRNFHKAIKEFHRVEAEAVEAAKPPAPVRASAPAGPAPATLASSREIEGPTREEVIRTIREAIGEPRPTSTTPIRTANPTVSSLGRPAPGPV
jgi:hypothetical protein